MKASPLFFMHSSALLRPGHLKFSHCDLCDSLVQASPNTNSLWSGDTLNGDVGAAEREKQKCRRRRNGRMGSFMLTCRWTRVMNERSYERRAHGQRPLWWRQVSADGSWERSYLQLGGQKGPVCGGVRGRTTSKPANPVSHVFSASPPLHHY